MIPAPDTQTHIQIPVHEVIDMMWWIDEELLHIQQFWNIAIQIIHIDYSAI